MQRDGISRDQLSQADQRPFENRETLRPRDGRLVGALGLTRSTVVERTWRKARKLGHELRDSKPVAKPNLTVQMCAKP